MTQHCNLNCIIVVGSVNATKFSLQVKILNFSLFPVSGRLNRVQRTNQLMDGLKE